MTTADKLVLTRSQEGAFHSLVKFLNSSSNIFILSGSAGTGKTTLLKIIIDHLYENDTPFSVGSPTGRSAQILRSKGINNAGTIHRMIYIHDTIVEEKSGSDLIYFFKLKTNNDSIKTVYLFDEASMISNQYSEGEFLRFGTGYLLNDLISYVSPNSSNQRKIILCGDENQLPPVNSNFSPALNKRHIENLSADLIVEEYELKEIVRQSGDSGIIKNASIIKENIEQNYLASIKLNFESEQFQKINPESSIKNFCLEYKKDSQSCVIISYTNAKVRTYNESARSILYNEPNILEEDDRIIVVRNNQLYSLLNGEMGIVKQVSPTPEIIKVPLKNENKPETLIFRLVTFAFQNESDEINEIEALILENLLTSPEGTLSKNQQRALLAHFVSRNKGIKKSSKEFLELLSNDPYINCLLIKYGYAITCHKAQGGEWDSVYFDFSHSSISKEYLRFCYTGITRAKKILYAINPPGPGFIKVKSETLETSLSSDQTDIIFTKNSFNESIKELIQTAVQDLDIEYELIDKPYCLRLKYSCGDATAFTDVIFRKNGLISGVNTNISEDINSIYNSIKRYEGCQLIEINEQDEPIENQFLSRLHKDISDKLKPMGINIVKTEHFNYLERFHFEGDKVNCSINIYYKAKNKISNILIHNGSKTLATKIIEVLK